MENAIELPPAKDIDLRTECLRLATLHGSQSGHLDVAKAEAYYNFILRRIDPASSPPTER